MRFLTLLSVLLVSLSAFSADRPNILFIIVDDQSPFDLRVYDPKSPLDSPNIDRLAAEGMVFDGAYHMGSFSGAVCTPSRHMVMSGRTVWHLPIAPNGKELCPPDIVENTMAAVFNRAGYDTMRTCKKGNSYAGANAQFTVVHDATKRGGDDESGSTWHGDQVINYLNEREAAKDEDPFIIYFGFSHPHDTRDGRPELLAKYGAVNHTDKNTPPSLHSQQPPLPPNHLLKHPFENSHSNVRDEVSVSGVWDKRDEATIRNELGREMACDENIDIQIGRVLKKLEAMGELDNTYIVYTADHGIAIGRHGLQGKQNLYEHTWRGVPIPETFEGESFKPVLEGKKETVRDVLYGVYNGGTKPGMRAVKKGDWKLIKYDVMDGEVRETQLFNLAKNPNELLPEHGQEGKMLTNLAINPKYADKLAEMEALLLEEMRRLDDPYRLWNQPDDGLTPPAKPKPREKKAKKAPQK